MSPLDPTIVVAIIGTAGLVLGPVVTVLVARSIGVKKEELERLRAGAKRSYALEDYCLLLRTSLIDAGIDVPPWPDELRQQRELVTSP